MAKPVSNSIGLSGNPFIDGLTQGGSWQFGSGPRVLTYSFNLNDNPNGGAWSQYPALQDAVDRAFGIWSQYIDVSFQSIGVGGVYYESPADIAVILTGNELGEGVLAVSLFPDNALADTFRQESAGAGIFYPNPEGDIALSNYDPILTQFGSPSLGMTVLLHEIGHALGLKHSDDDGVNGRPTFGQLGISAYDNLTYTMMGGDALNEYDYTLTPQVLDVLAMQHIYGANMTYHAGNDVYALQGGKNVIWDSGGVDTIDVSVQSYSGVLINLNPGNPFGHGNFGTTVIAYGTVIENAIGSKFDDRIIGNDANNELWGGDGKDTIEAGPGDDTLYGEGGLFDEDKLIGGPGNDTYYWGPGDRIFEDAPSGGSGIDTVIVRTNTNFGLVNGIENLIVLDQLYGSDFWGNALDNSLTVPANAHSVTGGPGDDKYFVAGSHTDVIENPNEGFDTIVASSSYRLRPNVENLRLAEGANNDQDFVVAEGNATDNVIEGNSKGNAVAGNLGNDRLLGGDGADALDGGGGNDWLDGQSGIDTMIGGAGDDTYVVDSEFSGTWISIIGAPTDGTSHASQYVYFSDASQLRETTLVDATNDGEIDQVILAFESDSQDGPSLRLHVSTDRRSENLRPGFFDDSMSPTFLNGLGHYGLEVSGGVFEKWNFAGWFDIIAIEFDYSGSTPQLTKFVMAFEMREQYVPKLSYHGFVQVDGAPVGEPAIEDENEGNDTVLASVDYTLPRHVERLTLTGTRELVGEGNEDANVIVGNANHNRLIGRGGDDVLDGNDGWDTAVYTGTSHQYALIEHHGAVHVVDRIDGRDGVDTTRNIEQAKFEGDNVTSLFTAADIFSPLEYIASYADLMAGFAANAQMGYEHFLAAGSAAMRTATFDGLEYLASQPDLIAGFGMDRDAATVHYIQSGRFEGRTVSFNGLEYLASYIDLVNSFGVNEDLGTMHYLTAGRNEGRTVTFRGLEYLASNPDLMAGYGDNFELATIHYISSGRFEGRVSSFHALEYIASYADLIQGIGANINAGALHYINSGRFEGRTEHFDAAQYLTNYADLAAGFGNNHELAALHFIQHGFYEGRTDQPGP